LAMSRLFAMASKLRIEGLHGIRTTSAIRAASRAAGQYHSLDGNPGHNYELAQELSA
jgi:hypothetical protein